MAAIALAGCNASKGTETAEEPGTGRLFLSGGKPAPYATVRVYKVGAVPEPAAAAKGARASAPAKALGAVLVTRTDGEGRYQVGAIENGEYNILANLDSEYAYMDSVALGGTTGVIPPDTLADPSTVRGRVAVEPQDNPATVLVQLLGTNRFANVDEQGDFEFRDLAAGSYSVRVFTSEPDYTPSYSTFKTGAGGETVLPGVLRPIFTGIPAVTGLRVSYDTANGVAYLRWNRVQKALMQDYLLYRDAGEDAPALSPAFAFTKDTVFADSLWNRAPFPEGGFGGARLAYDDSSARPFTWRVVPRLKTQATGPFLYSASLTAISPKWVRLQASLRLGGRHADAATIGDTVPVIAEFLNPLHRIATLRWYDDEKDPPLRETHPNVTSGSDTLIFRTGTVRAPRVLIAHLIDEAGVSTRLTFTVKVFDDQPLVSAVFSPGRQPILTDTILLEGSASDLGRIVKWEWSIGGGPFIRASKPETTLAVDRALPAGQPFAILRATDEDGAVGSAPIAIDVLPWKKLTRMPRPRADFTATVVDGKIYLLGGGGTVGDVYDPVTDTWEALPPMNSSRLGHQAAVFGDEIMLVGGRTDDQRGIVTCEFFNVKTRAWREGPNLILPRLYLGLSKIGSRLFAFGGVYNDGFESRGDVEVYDSAGSRWERYGTDVAPNARFSSGVVGNITYALGGTLGPLLNTIDFLGNASRLSGLEYGTWVSRATAVHGRHILAAGGATGNAGTPYVDLQAYDTQAQNAKLVAKMQPVTRAALAVVGGKAFIFGGVDPATGKVLDRAQVLITPLDSALAP